MNQIDNSTKSRYHELKTAPAPFICVSLDQKRAEFRKNDRDFKVLDTLILREYDIFHGYTGSYELRYITHIQEGFGIPDGYVMLSIRPLTEKEQAYHSAGIKERVCIRDCIQCNQNPEGHCADDEPIEEQHRDVSQSS